MTPAARIQASIDLLDTLSRGRGPADRSVAAWFRRRRFIGAKDRRAVTDRVFGVLRRASALDWWLARAAGRGGREPAPGTARARVMAALALEAGAGGAAAVAALFDGSRYGPAPLSDAEAALVRALAGEPIHHPEQPVHVRANYPAWLDPKLRRARGGRLEAEMAALNEPASFDLRVNTLKATREEARAALSRDGLEAAPTPLSPVGLRLGQRRPLGGLMCFGQGWIEVQDEGSQLVSLLVDARPGMRVVDFCAGGGGKTLAMAAMMQNRGKIVALDVSRRLARAEPRLQRAGVAPDLVVLHRLGAAEAGGDGAGAGAGGVENGDVPLPEAARDAERVLLDAPCTGLGAWRRDPVSRWRLSPGDVARLAATQRRILERACGLVRPGGRLVYATCSLLAEENEDQMSEFLARHEAFGVVPVARVWAETVGGACPAEGDFLRLSPARTATDGFFLAVLERRA